MADMTVILIEHNPETVFVVVKRNGMGDGDGMYCTVMCIGAQCDKTITNGVLCTV